MHVTVSVLPCAGKELFAMDSASVSLVVAKFGNTIAIVTKAAPLFWWAVAVVFALVSLALGFKFLKIALFAVIVAVYAYVFPEFALAQITLFAGLPLIWSLFPGDPSNLSKQYQPRRREALVIRDLMPFYDTGQVIEHGEVWGAVCDEPVPAGEVVEILYIIGCKMRVQRIDDSKRTA